MNIKKYNVVKYIEPVFMITLFIGYRTKKRKNFVRRILGIKPEEIEQNGAATTWTINKETIFIEINEYFDITDSERMIHFGGIAAHEAFHASQFLVQRIGQGYDVEHDEPFAYFCGWVSRCMFDTLYKFSENKRRLK
jgi:hypothetical protein